ncbi:MAG TPA: 2-dehydropantoate 2-reductase [Hyphomicrobiaceae bacterium]|jgi:2-dehydropantoate 2-reductase|nr:2-dehydropantoate 2-reductase [Hyphomicrobiaceae bacterium]
MAKWIRFDRKGSVGFGTLEGDTIAVHSGDMFAGAKPTGEKVKLSEVRVLTPCTPSKMIGLWNNFHQLAAKNDFQKPDDPLYFLKAPNAFHPHGSPIERPPTYAGKIVYEAELGVVIGKKCFNVSEAEAPNYIFGYTCVNDVTAVDLLKKFPTFDQWARAKSFDTFGVFGPVIATDVDPMKLSVRAVLNGKEVQNYPVSDMFFPPAKLVAAVSKDMTLLPGDIIACGTSLGAGVMRAAKNTIDVVIDGVGTLSNTFEQELPSPYLLEGAPKPIRICVVGAGAIGGLMAAKFALAGNDVTVIDQGVHLAAIQKNGIKLEWHDGKVQTAKVKGVSSATEAGKQDLVVLAVKAHFLDQVVRDIDHLLGPDTVVLTVQNGLPWWYFQRLGGKYDNQRLHSLDPSGILTKKVDASRLIGCVVYPAAAVTAPGVIHHVEGDRFPIGELDGKDTERAKRLHDVFVKAGLQSRVLKDIRSEIWLKAWGNLSFNPISALTHATLVDICQFAETRELAATMMREAQEIAQKLGVTFRVSIEKRIAGAESVGAHKTSMLQDVEAGRSLETEALIGSILEMAQLTNTPAPAIAAVYACVKLLNKVMLTEGGGVKVEKAKAA